VVDVPDFSKMASEYAASRPVYPAELFAWLAGVSPAREIAWDVATGNGQAAVGLATHFARVIGSDVSARQLENAWPHPRVAYRLGTAEESGLAPGSIDLVTAAAAVHWFDLSRFYDEARRVLREGGVLAAWTYHVAHVTPLGDVLAPFYDDVVASYFAPGARMVDARYEGLGLPGEELRSPPFEVSVRWNADQVLRFVRTWSGVEAYRAAHGRDPVLEIEGPIREALGGGSATLRFPLYVRASRV